MFLKESGQYKNPTQCKIRWHGEKERFLYPLFPVELLKKVANPHNLDLIKGHPYSGKKRMDLGEMETYKPTCWLECIKVCVCIISVYVGKLI